MSITAVIHWLGGLAAWTVLVLLMIGIWQGTRRTPGRSSGRAAGWLRSPVFYVLALSAFLAFSMWGWRPLPFKLPPAYQEFALLAGCLLYFPGMGLILWGRMALGRMYFVSTSMGAQLFDGHRLVTTGPFGLLRHPMYVGLFAAALGSLLIYGTWTTLAFAVFAPSVLLRARREEQVLAAAFDKQWLEYCRNVPAFWPSLERSGRAPGGARARQQQPSHSRRLLRDFDRYARDMRDVLVRFFGQGSVDDLTAQARREYATIIPQLPYIGGKQPFTQFLTFTGLYLAVYRAAKAYGKTVEETGEILYEIGRSFLRTYPSFLRSFLGRMNFSKLYISRLRTRARESKLRKYAGDYVFDFVQGDGVSFDYGVDYLECASCKFLAAQDASELAAYLCPVDILYSEALGWGLRRTSTLAEGGERCDFRFKNGGPTRVAVPASMRKVVGRSR